MRKPVPQTFLLRADATSGGASGALPFHVAEHSTGARRSVERAIRSCYPLAAMSETPITRRDFLASSATLAGAANLQTHAGTSPAQPGRRASTGPVRILTMTNFEPHEIAKIQAAAPNVQLTIVKSGRSSTAPASGGGGLREVSRGPTRGGAGPMGADRRRRRRNMDPEFVESPIVLTNMARTFAPAISETAIGCCCASRAASRRSTCRSSRSGR